MKYIKYFNNNSNICREYGIENYTTNPDGSIDVNGNVYIKSKKLTKLPIKFNKVMGDFTCFDGQLTTLEGAPKEVLGDFNCSNNQLTTLEGAPEKVGGYFFCPKNQLTTLKGAPKEVMSSFSCKENKLTTLEGAPEKVGGAFFCHRNQLISLKGCPEKVYLLDCSYNKLTSLENGPKVVYSDIDCSHNELTSLRGLPEDFESDLNINDNPVNELFILFRYCFIKQSNDETSSLSNRIHKIAHLLNEYDVISLNGKKIYRDNLEEVFNVLGIEMPHDLKFDSYEIH